MSKRSALRAVIVQDPEITAIIPAASWVQRGAILETTPDKPFGIIAAVGPQIQPGARSLRRPEDFEIWVHSRDGSYVLIDKVIGILSERLEATVQFTFNGFRISQISVQGVGPDLNDDVLRTVTRSLRVRVSGEPV